MIIYEQTQLVNNQNLVCFISLLINTDMAAQFPPMT